MIKIGITGGIGSGKSIIATLLDLSGVPVYIADEESKKLTESSPVIKEKLIARFGPDLYMSEKLDKRLLASYIFNDPEALRQVNAIIHPEVNRHFQEWVARQDTSLCAIESAILFESGFDKVVDVRLMVYAPLEVRIKRALRRDAVSREEIERRIQNQLPDEEKKDRSDFVIYNDDKQALIPQVRRLIGELTR